MIVWGTRIHEDVHTMVEQLLPKEFYIDPGPGSPADVEHICTQATNRSANDVVAVAVTPDHVAQAADLLFGTGIGVVSSIIDSGANLIDQARRSVARGATEIALPRLMLDQPAILTRLRARLGTFTPVTVGLNDGGGELDLASAASALQLGADYVSYAPSSTSLTSKRNVAALLALASELQLGGVKIATPTSDHSWFEPAAPAAAARLRVPLSFRAR